MAMRGIRDACTEVGETIDGTNVEGTRLRKLVYSGGQGEHALYTISQRREGDHSWSPEYHVSQRTFAMSECSAVRNDRPPKSRDVSRLSRGVIAWDCKRVKPLCPSFQSWLRQVGIGTPLGLQRGPFARHSNLGSAKFE